MENERTPKTNFTRILFESDVLEALTVLAESLNQGEFDQAVEWLTAWQDLIDASGSPLSPLLDSLQEDDSAVVLRSLQVLNGLISAAPDRPREFRIKNELKELKFEQLLGQVSLRWEKNPQIRKEVDRWFGIGHEDENKMATDVEPVLSDLRCLLTDDAAKEQRIRVILGLLDTLKNVKNTQDAEETLRKLIDTDENSNSSSLPDVVAPPPPPPLASSLPPVVPPPPPPQCVPGPPPPPPPPSFAKGPPGAPPPPPIGGFSTLSKPATVELPASMKPKKVPDKDLKMKTLMWSKLPPSALNNEAKTSVWGQLASEPRGFSLDFEVIEGMFSMAQSVSANGDLSGSSNSINFKKKDTMVDLLTPKRSQNVTITLKRFKNLDEVLSNIRENKAEAFEAEMLRALKGILPDEEEVDALKRYGGDVALLSPACSFFLQILSIQDYKLRIDCLLYRLEFCSTMDEVMPQLATVAQASLEILQSAALKRLLLLLVNIGNFLNGATAHGNAAGFKLNSLWKMIDMKAAKGGASLLHALAKMDVELLKDLEEELPTVKSASEISIEEAKKNLQQLTDQSKSLEKNIQVKTDECFQQMREHLQDHCGEELQTARNSLETISQRQQELAAYFCENKNSFRAEECFKIFSNFVTRLRVAVQENQERAERAAKKMVRQSASDESVPSLRETTNFQAPEEKLFATLEKGSGSLKMSRRRSSVRTVLEFSRERDADQEVKLQRLREKVEENAEKSEDNGETPTSTPKIVRRTRRSLQIEGATTLTDFMVRLQESSFVRPSPSTPKVPEETITVNIPSESDGCQSTPSTSPKSSDEGFESEKDKESEKVEEAPVPPSSAIPSSSTLPRRSSAPKENSKAPPRLISITTSDLPKTSTLPRSSQLVKPRTLTTKAVPPQNTSSPVPPKTKSSSLPRPSTQPTAPSRKIPAPGVAKSIPKAVVNSVARPPPAKKMTSVAPTASVAQRTLNGTAGIASRTSAPTKPVAAPRRIPGPRLAPLTRASTTSGSSPPKTPSPAVSTSARPSLIKTGSLSQPKPLRGMEAVEKPRPLKKTASTSTAPKPKWV